MLPLGPVQVREYLDARGRSPFRKWADSLDSVSRVKVITAIARLERGNFANVRNVGKGVLEKKIDVGPGLRVSFALDADRIVLLLGGSTKRRQAAAIRAAQQVWRDYRRRKAQGRKRRWH